MTGAGQPGATNKVMNLRGNVVLKAQVSGAGTPVVVLHGFTGDASTMADVSLPLARHHQVISMDLIGHGGSTGQDPASYSIDAMVEQVLEAAATIVPAAPFDLIGYSMGGRVALTLACRAPGRVRSLCLIGASAGLATTAERTDRIAADEALANSIETDGLEHFVDAWMANPLFATQARLGVAALADCRAQRLRNDGVELSRSLRAAGTGQMMPLHDRLGSCGVPTTLVVGGEDHKFRSIAVDLVDRLRDASVAVIPEAGHAAHLENPEAVVAAVRSRIEGSPDHTSTRLRLALRAPLTTARGETTVRESILYSRTAGGHTGWGEAAPLPGWSEESIDECESELCRARHGSFEEIVADLDSTGAPLAARAAVVGAVLDAEARQRGVLLRDLLAERFGEPAATRDELAVNCVVSARGADQVTAQVARAAARGYSTVKLKVAAAPLAVDVGRVAAARAAAPAVVLRLDANGGWTPEEAIEALGRLAPYDIALCEEPTTGIDANAVVAAQSPVPVGVDESARRAADHAGVWPHAEAGAIAALVIKPQAIGGVDLAMTAIGEAQRRGIDVIVTTMVDSAIGVAHAAHVAAAAGLAGANGLGTADLFEHDVADAAAALPIVDGWLRFAADTDPARWGHGLAIGPISPGSGSPP